MHLITEYLITEYLFIVDKVVIGRSLSLLRRRVGL